MKSGWIKERKIIAVFAVIALLGGILFLDPGVTGSLILKKKIQFSSLSLIGVILVICSVILASYSLLKK
jgi:hypothetical protein